MTASQRRFIFLIVATICNIALVVLIFIALISLYSFSLGRIINKEYISLALLITFIGACILAGVIYMKVLRTIQKNQKTSQRFGLRKEQ